MHLHRLIDKIHHAFVQPVFGDGRRDARKRCRLAARFGIVETLRHAEHQRRRRLGFDRHIGEERAHCRLVDQFLLEGRAVRGVPAGERQRLTHVGGRCDGAVESGVVHHLDDSAHAAAVFADHRGYGAAIFDFRRGIGAIA